MGNVHKKATKRMAAKKKKRTKDEAIQNALSVPGVDGQIDFSVFSDCTLSKCTGTAPATSPTAGCSHLQRLCAALKFWDLVSSSKLSQERKETLLVEFNEEIYHSVVNDTVHLTKVHEGDLEAIYGEWVENHGFPNCTVSDCVKTARHYGRGRRERAEEKDGAAEGDALYLFYEAQCDRVHNYVFGGRNIELIGLLIVR